MHEQPHRSTTAPAAQATGTRPGRRALLCAIVLGVLLALFLPASSFAANPVLTIGQPTNNEYINQTTPVFSGTTNETGLSMITVRVYAGSHAEGTVVGQVTIVPTLPAWSAALTATLAPGRYTAQAEQVTASDAVGLSPAVTFVIDTTAPYVSISQIASPTDVATPQLSGGGGTAEGDLKSVTVTVHQGATTAGSVVEQGAVPVSAGSWSYAVPHLADGQYTAQATQLDEAGNLGTSETETFTVDTTPPALSMTSPAAGSMLSSLTPTLRGTAGAAAGDLQFVTVKLYAGATPSGTPVQQVTLSSAEWSTGHVALALKDGVYTALSEQSDQAGNVGKSQATFTVAASPPPVTVSLPGAVVREALPATGAKPSFTGSAGAAAEDGTSIVLHIYTGEEASGTPVQTLDAQASAGSWSATATGALPEGTYTAVAEQQDSEFFGHNGASPKLVFRVITTPPVVTVQAPGPVTGTAVSLSGTASDAEGDEAQVTVTLYAGSEPTSTPLQTLIAPVTDGAWTGAFAGLTPGTYTALAQQSDDFGNTGKGKPATFTVTAALHSAGTPAPSATPASSTPIAAFEWFPHQPQVGEAVSLISTSTDLDSAITSYSWALAPSAAFKAGEVMLHTSFAEAGDQHVRLQISDALGHTALVEQTIDVVPAVAGLIDPFPVVRIAGTDTAHSVHLRLLSVLAPIGTQVTVLCHGRGCPARVRSFRATAPADKPGLAFLALRHYERTWHAGTILQIEVSKAGDYGKYTRFEILAGRLPRRVDECLSPTGSPVACPD